MQFVVIGLDGEDAGAKGRREAARPGHISRGEELRLAGHLWFGAALFDSSGQMNGSMYLVDFDNRDAMEDWLNTEPYVVGDVWKTLSVYDANVRDPWQFTREKEFYLGRTAR